MIYLPKRFQSYIADRILNVTALEGMIVMVVLCAIAASIWGCSATKDIAKQASNAHGTLADIAKHADAIRDDTASLRVPQPTTGKVQPAPIPPETLGVLDDIDGHAQAIQNDVAKGHKQVGNIQKDIPSVVDAVPWWANLLKTLAVFGIVAAIIYALIATGAMTFIRGWLGLSTPAPKSLTTP